MKHSFTARILISILIIVTGPTWAASADSVVQSCKTAISETEGTSYNDASLKRIKPRGSSYEAWFNISGGNRELKSYCYIKRGEIEQLVTSEGRWSSNPKRPTQT
jgi:hypothetical protein